MKPFTVWFYNLATPTERHQSGAKALVQVSREVRAILSHRPAALGMVEAVGYRLPEVKGYRLLRDTSSPSRANVAAYVRADLTVEHERWVDAHQTWSRTEHKGTHEARSYLVARLDGTQFIVVHQPPRFTDNTEAAQQEGIDLLTHLMTGKRRSTAPGDYNRTAHQSGPGPRSLAEAVGGHVYGADIDCAVARGHVTCSKVTKRRRVRNGLRWVRMRSDHKHAVRFDFQVQED